MAAVTVFVDDAVQGRFPHLCAKTGAPADGMLTIHTPVRTQTGLLWLVLLGPFGLAAILVIMSMGWRYDEILTVQLPWTEAAQRELDDARERRRKRWYACLALVALATVVNWISGGGVLSSEMAGVFVFAAVVVGMTAVGASVGVDRASVDVRLDASRRWVTLGNVHDDFARAVEVVRAGRHPAAP